MVHGQGLYLHNRHVTGTYQTGFLHENVIDAGDYHQGLVVDYAVIEYKDPVLFANRSTQDYDLDIGGLGVVQESPPFFTECLRVIDHEGANYF
jgi:hypothetical protein